MKYILLIILLWCVSCTPTETESPNYTKNCLQKVSVINEDLRGYIHDKGLSVDYEPAKVINQINFPSYFEVKQNTTFIYQGETPPEIVYLGKNIYYVYLNFPTYEINDTVYITNNENWSNQEFKNIYKSFYENKQNLENYLNPTTGLVRRDEKPCM
jgi:hypothetical protein